MINYFNPIWITCHCDESPASHELEQLSWHLINFDAWCAGFMTMMKAKLLFFLCFSDDPLHVVHQLLLSFILVSYYIIRTRVLISKVHFLKFVQINCWYCKVQQLLKPATKRNLLFYVFTQYDSKKYEISWIFGIYNMFKIYEMFTVGAKCATLDGRMERW